MTIADMEEIHVISSRDGSSEPSFFFFPVDRAHAPLVVGLHTWSCDRFNLVESLLPECRKRGWALLLPEFRGPNLAANPRAAQAGGSTLARQDVLDAMDHVITARPIDKQRLFLIGGSGGGHMALLLAAAAPDRWRGVSAWVPVTDLAAWHGQNEGYAPHIRACCGGAPRASSAVDREYKDRSPLNHAARIAKACVSVHHGRFDTSVPHSHTVKLVEAVEAHKPMRFYYDIFDGAHEILYPEAFAWFDRLSEGDRRRTERLSG
ncbi:MAG: prolyl oligopeptidase family serine peptidase [Planctomycetota bacterium]